MKLFKRSTTVLALAFGLAATGTVPLCAASGGWFQEYPAPYGGLRGLVDRVQSDLREAAELEHGKGDQRDRYRNAQRHLSTFDRHLTKGHFDKGELDSAISDIQSILDKNVLQASSRDTLLRDVEDLRVARDRHY